MKFVTLYHVDANKAVFASCKIFSGNAIFGKGKYFQVFGCIPKNVLKIFYSVWLFC